MVSALVCCSAARAVVTATAGRSIRRAAAPLRAPRRQMVQHAARRPISTSIVAQSLERKVQTEGTGPSPKQGDKVSHRMGCGPSGRRDGAARRQRRRRRRPWAGATPPPGGALVLTSLTTFHPTLRRSPCTTPAPSPTARSSTLLATAAIRLWCVLLAAWGGSLAEAWAAAGAALAAGALLCNSHHTCCGTLSLCTPISAWPCLRPRLAPLQFNIGMQQVIRGWDEGVMQMKVGERCTLICPPDYAYGARGAGGVIPPSACVGLGWWPGAGWREALRLCPAAPGKQLCAVSRCRSLPQPLSHPALSHPALQTPPFTSMWSCLRSTECLLSIACSALLSVAPCEPPLATGPALDFDPEPEPRPTPLQPSAGCSHTPPAPLPVGTVLHMTLSTHTGER